MKIRKVLVVASMALAALPSLGALTIDEILTSARDVSYSVKNASLLHDNNLLLIRENELDDEPVWSVDLSVKPFSSSDFSNDKLDIDTLSASVTLPDDDATTITLSSPIEIGYENGSFLIEPSITASHTFDFNYFNDDRITDLTNASSSLSTERLYLEALYSFDKSVITELTTLLNLEKNIKDLEHTISNAERDLNNMLTLKEATEDSITYTRALLDLDMNRRSLKTYEDQYEKAKEQFKISTGLTWDGLEEFSIPSLSLSPLESGNSEVRGLSLDSEVASLKVEEKEKAMNPETLLLSGSVGGSFRNEAGRVSYDEENKTPLFPSKPWRNSMNGNIGVTFNLSNWSIGASFGLSGEKGESVNPSLTLSGSWKNNTSSRRDRIELERLRNDAVSAQNDYLDALTNYNIKAMEIQNSIMEYEFKLSTLKQNESYLKASLELEEDYYEKGLVSEDEVEDARVALDLFSYDKMITLLEGLSLYYDILIYSL